MTDILLEKKFGSLAPASDDAFRVLMKIPNGAHVVADVKDQSRRSTRQHNFIFVLMTLLYEAQEHFTDFTMFRQYLLIRLGFCDVFKPFDGEPITIAHSMSFSKMTADEAGRLADAVLDFAEQMGFDRAALLAETQDRAGPLPEKEHAR